MSDRDEHDAANDESRYGDELLRANWNPVIDLLQWSVDLTTELTRPARNDGLSDEDAADFLGRFYTSGA